MISPVTLSTITSPMPLGSGARYSRLLWFHGRVDGSTPSSIGVVPPRRFQFSLALWPNMRSAALQRPRQNDARAGAAEGTHAS